jgi:hypothetical protein
MWLYQNPSVFSLKEGPGHSLPPDKPHILQQTTERHNLLTTKDYNKHHKN